MNAIKNHVLTFVVTDQIDRGLVKCVFTQTRSLNFSLYLSWREKVLTNLVDLLGKCAAQLSHIIPDLLDALGARWYFAKADTVGTI